MPKSPKLTNIVIKGDTYAKFRSPLEEIHVVDWPFQFFDNESRCMIKCKFKGLNSFFLGCRSSTSS